MLRVCVGNQRFRNYIGCLGWSAQGLESFGYTLSCTRGHSKTPSRIVGEVAYTKVGFGLRSAVLLRPGVCLLMTSGFISYRA